MPLRRKASLEIDVLEHGAGPALLLLHSAGTGSAQWRSLIAELAADFRCLAPNQRGYGRSLGWLAGRPSECRAELELIEAVLPDCGRPVHVIGHSMGAWLALHLARRAPALFDSLVLIEPVALGLLHERGEGAALAEVGAMIEEVLASFAGADVSAALERFTDYWYGSGAWDRLPTAQRLPVFARASKMQSDLRMMWADRAGTDDYRAIALPTLILRAEHTSFAARRMSAILAETMVASRLAIIPAAGHMAPATHAASVAALIRAHVAGLTQ